MMNDKPLFWYGSWFKKGHNNCRYAALLPQMNTVDKFYHYRSNARLRLYLYRYLDKNVCAQFFVKRKLARLAKGYSALFCTSPEQIPHFRGPIIVDDDDPSFDASHIRLLNAKNVLAVVTTTAKLQESLAQAGLQKSCYVIPSGVHTTDLNVELLPALQNRLGKQSDDFVVGFAAPHLYMDSDKETASPEGKLRSISFLAAVMAQVWRANSKIKLWLIGKPSASVMEYAAGHSCVKLIGYVNHRQILNHYALFNVGLYPRNVDFQGRHSIKLLEYMAVGLPIVSTAVAEAFHIQAASSGLIASDRDTFSEHILQLSKNPELCVNLGSAGKAYAAKYDWSVLARQYDEQVLPAILKRFDVVRCPPTRTAST